MSTDEQKIIRQRLRQQLYMRRGIPLVITTKEKDFIEQKQKYPKVYG